MAVITGRKAILDIFSAEGIDFIFGNPGTTEFPIIETMADYPQMRYIMALQEGVALGIAHGYANASGKTGVVNLHVAPGLGNAIGALHNASVGKIPLLVTAGQQDTRMVVREPCLSGDLVEMVKPLVKWSVQIQHPEEIPVIIPRALKTAQDSPRGPVFVSLPIDVLEGESDFAPYKAPDLYRRTRPDAEGAAAAVSLLASAKSPVIICGDRVYASGAEEELVKLAEMLGAQVWNVMFSGSLNFPFDHPQYLGTLPGEHGVIRSRLAKADVVLAVGANIFDEIFITPDNPIPDSCTFIHLDSASREIGKNITPAIGLLADPKLALVEIIEGLNQKMDESSRKSAVERKNILAEEKKREWETQKKRLSTGRDQVPISVARLMADLKEAMPVDTIIYNESITASVDLFRTMQPSDPKGFFANHGGGIGQGLPAAIGVKLAHPDRPLVSVVGDGSAMYTIQSFWSAAHHNIPVVYIINSNRTYRVLKYNMNRHRRTYQLPVPEKPFPHMDLNDPPIDFVQLAKAMGVDGAVAKHPDEIKPALEKAFSSGKPFVLEVLTEGSVSP